jgi:hypothetical protein
LTVILHFFGSFNDLEKYQGKNRKVSKDPIMRFEVAWRSSDEWDIIDEKEKKIKGA